MHADIVVTTIFKVAFLPPTFTFRLLHPAPVTGGSRAELPRRSPSIHAVHVLGQRAVLGARIMRKVRAPRTSPDLGVARFFRRLRFDRFACHGGESATVRFVCDDPTIFLDLRSATCSLAADETLHSCRFATSPKEGGLGFRYCKGTHGCVQNAILFPSLSSEHELVHVCLRELGKITATGLRGQSKVGHYPRPAAGRPRWGPPVGVSQAPENGIKNLKHNREWTKRGKAGSTLRRGSECVCAELAMIEIRRAGKAPGYPLT
jgi:hypothetical protein